VRRAINSLSNSTLRNLPLVEATSSFDEVDHDWLVRMLEQRVDDRAPSRG
jgi:hypothetical protein